VGLGVQAPQSTVKSKLQNSWEKAVIRHMSTFSKAIKVKNCGILKGNTALTIHNGNVLTNCNFKFLSLKIMTNPFKIMKVTNHIY